MSYPVTTNFAGSTVEISKFHSPFNATDYAAWLSRERGDAYTITVHTPEGDRLISLNNGKITYRSDAWETLR